MKYPKIGDKVQVVMNEIVQDLNEPFHHYELGATVRVVRVSDHLIYCTNSKGLNQALKPTHVRKIKNQ